MYPITILLWYIGSFFQSTKNRPKSYGCCLFIWKKYVECLYKKAINKHLQTNPQFRAPDINWQYY